MRCGRARQMFAVGYIQTSLNIRFTFDRSTGYYVNVVDLLGQPRDRRAAESPETGLVGQGNGVDGSCE